MEMKKYISGVPYPGEIREIMYKFIQTEAFVMFSCDFGVVPLNTMMFAFENPETPIEPFIHELRKNGISILCIQRTPLKRTPIFPCSDWYEITFMAYSNEN